MVYKDDVVYELWKKEDMLYYHNLLTGEDKLLSKEKRHIGYVFGYHSSLWEREIILGDDYGIYSLSIDSLNEKTIYKSTRQIYANVVYKPVVPIKEYVEKEKYGHYTTDIILVDIRDGSVKRLTDDEEYQWAPQRYENIVIYHENFDKKSTDIDYGYIVVFDTDKMIKRRVPRSEGLLLPGSTNGRYVLYTDRLGSEVSPMYLMDLEKLGVVKDGHVVPE